MKQAFIEAICLTIGIYAFLIFFWALWTMTP
jgi:hypothetical protein